MQDFAWLELMNERRAKENLCTISEDLFELAMDRFEKESFFQCESLALDGSKPAAVDEDALCSVCGSGESEPDNSILFCDLCNIAVHQVTVTEVESLCFVDTGLRCDFGKDSYYFICCVLLCQLI